MKKYGKRLLVTLVYYMLSAFGFSMFVGFITPYNFGILFIVGVGILVWLIGFITGLWTFVNWVMFSRYLRHNKYRRWREVFLMPDILFSPYPSDALKRFEKKFDYIFNNVDNKNEAILRYKDKIRIGITIFLISWIVFGTIVTSMTLMTVLFK